MCDRVAEHLDVHVGVLLCEVKTWARAYCLQAARGHIDTPALHLLHEPRPVGVSASFEVYIKSKAEAATTDVRDPVRTLLADFEQLAPEVVTGPVGVLHEVLVADDLVLAFHECRAHRISHPCVEVPVGELRPELIRVVEAARLRFLREGNEVRRRVQVPVLVRPELARASDARVHLVHDHVDAELLGQSAQLVGVEARDVVVAAGGKKRLEHDSRNLNALNSLPVLNLLTHVTKRGELLLPVKLYVGRVIQGVPVRRGISHWPIERRDVYLSERTDPICIPGRRQTS